MHICHLGESPAENIVEFVIPLTGNDITLFSIDNIPTTAGRGIFAHRGTVRPKIIAGQNTRSDEPISDLNYKVTKNVTGERELDITITFSKSGGANSPLENDNSKIVVKRDPNTDNFIARTSNQTKIEKITVTLAYELKDHTVYSYQFIIHLPKTDPSTEMYKVAVDFGSEASQIGYKKTNDTATYNIPIVDVLKNFYGQYRDETTFWQGNYRDQDPEASRLYKSIFFVNRNPVKGYQYKDRPNEHGRNTLLQTLTPRLDIVSEATNESEFDYRDLTLLPNLKLIELLSNTLFRDDEINFGTDTEMNGRKYSGKVSVLTIPEVYVRLILNNFLYTVMERICPTNTRKYLQVTLLMPNVYSQDKVYQLINHLYSDFRTIRDGNTRYACFKGLEVQALSESDASFIGARNFNGDDDNKISNKEDANYLVIDAGKGTTDFSIIKQQGRNHVKYESTFRTGLPGSGQYLTHAFITALNKFLKESLADENISLEHIIYEADDISAINGFMEHMETLKKMHTAYTELTEAEKARYIESIRNYSKDKTNFNRFLDLINEFIEAEFINKKKRVPGSHDVIVAQIDSFVQQIDKCIQWAKTDQFYQVVFAGRAFQFDPFRQAVENKLRDRVTGAAKFVFHKKNQSKFICVEGAFKNEFVSINLNSELIGCPVIIDKNVAEGTAAKKDKAGNHRIEINEQFFYEGIHIGDLEGKEIGIGAREYEIPLQARESGRHDFNLFYTGDGFIIRWDEDAVALAESRPFQDLNAMVEATLFPFAKKSLDSRPGRNRAKDNGTSGGPADHRDDQSQKGKPGDDNDDILA